MFCNFCGASIEDDAEFCTECGRAVHKNVSRSPQNIEDGIKQAKNVATKMADTVAGTAQGTFGQMKERMSEKNDQITNELSAYDINPNSRELRDIFVDPEETFVAKLGNGFLVNLLVSKQLKRCAGLLSDKRAYFKGTLYTQVDGKFRKCTCMQTIDVEDVTGTGFLYQQVPPLFFIVSILIVALGTFGGFAIDEDILMALLGFFVTIIPACLYYFLSKKTYFFIEYAGGKIMFNASIIGIEDVNDFQKQIRRVKDKVKGKI